MNRLVVFFVMLVVVSFQLSGCSSHRQKTQPIPKEGTLKIEKNSVRPQQVSAGAMVEAIVQYTVILPEGLQDTSVTETRTLVNGDEKIVLSKKNVVRATGTHTSKMKLTLPMDIDPGEYQISVTVSTGRFSRTAKSRLMILGEFTR